MSMYCMVGMKFRDAVDLVNGLESGTELFLEREADNSYDANAVKVLYGDRHVAYIKGQEVAPLARRMDNDSGLAEIPVELVFRDAWPYVDTSSWD